MFFDDDFEQVRLSPRLFRFLLVYILVGLTFTALAAGATERRGRLPAADLKVTVEPAPDQSDYAQRHTTGVGAERIGEHKRESFANVCSAIGWQQVAPQQCTVPLDFISGISLWWAASPVFSVLLPIREQPGALGYCRYFMQRWRKHIDIAILTVSGILLFCLWTPCASVAPIAFGNAEFGAWGVALITLLRRISPMVFDGWRGPLAHLEQPSGPIFSHAQCSVCLMDLVQGEDICRTPCSHDFHRSCLEEWVLSNRYGPTGCPLCREPILGRGSNDLSRICFAGDCLL